ncbi:hypothetical protein FHS82_004194 [Pseudochelatococcus lubricantis]|uniref:Phasin domain-containing protein n=1 Tax=Pseudochelatococcus lubricantis TaxID=1538102 RepID=A0ABX0V5A9_9HYPH|nr:phasin family protein [Pseudochelatococcus lubricantis]NIJ60323.1 hypothetical protein [Pseudochelatococcus lubricantis]
MSNVQNDSQNQSVNADGGYFYFPDLSWLKDLGQSPAKVYVGLYRNALRATARQLQAQADYLRELSEAEGTQDVFARQSEFAQKAVANWIDEGQRLFALSRESSVTSR